LVTTGRSRLVPIIAGAAIACALGVVVWLLAGRFRTPSAATLAASLPPSAPTVFFVDLGALRRAGLLDRLAGPGTPTAAADNEYRDFIQQTGFDYRRDLDAVSLAFAPGGAHYLALAGRFNWKALAGYATAHGGACDAVGYCYMPASQPGRTVSFYPARRSWFGPSGVLAMGVSTDNGAARMVGLPARSSGAPPPVPSEPVWVATTGRSLSLVRGALPSGTTQFARVLEGAEHLVLALDAQPQQQASYQLALDALCATPQEAAILLMELETITSMVRKMIAGEKRQPNPRDLSGVLAGGVFRKDDRRVTGAWPVRREFFDSLAGAP